MGHLIKYRMLQTIRKKSQMFWALAFPIILGTFFYISFGSGEMGEDMEAVPTALVIQDKDSDTAKAFTEYMDRLDGSAVQITYMTDEEAEKALRQDKVEGIFYCTEEPALTVAGSGISQSILKSLLDSYCKNASMIMSVAREHPQGLSAAAEAMEDWQEMTESFSVKGRTMDSNISYFFALIAYACLSGAFLGAQSSVDSQADISALGARRSVTPTHKIQLILTDMLVLFFIHFCNVGILTGYIRFGLGIRLGGDVCAILLTICMGSMIGISIGMVLGCIRRLSFGGKMGMCVCFTLIPGFLAGLMFGQMKDVIEHHCPLVNRLNPAAVLSDAFYCIGVYDNPERLMRNLLILGMMSAVAVLAAWLLVRRECYDSI